MRYKCVVAYDGTQFSGFQVQKNLRTVQAEIEKALLPITKVPVVIYPSGRTDAGVHASGQVIHFDIDRNIGAEAVKRALNSRLPADIRVVSAVGVDSRFHARFCAIAKIYEYYIDFGTVNPLLRRYRYYCPYRVDIARFKEAFSVYTGTHDFRSFAKESGLEDTVRTIFSIDFCEEGSLMVIRFTGNGFLRHMIRILVAMALEVGRSKITVDDLKSILEQKNRQLAPKIVPPAGLVLRTVKYPEEEG